MKIQLKQIKIRDLTNQYKDLKNQGVRGYGGLMDIRPPYQREFVYKDPQKIAVIQTVRNGFPLNVMYWVVNKNTSQPDGGNKIDETVAKYGLQPPNWVWVYQPPRPRATRLKRPRHLLNTLTTLIQRRLGRVVRWLHLYAQSSTYRPRPVPRIRS